MADITCAQVGRPQKYTEGLSSKSKCICLFDETFVKLRELWVDPSESVWYAVEQYGEGTERNVSTCIYNGPPAVMHS